MHVWILLITIGLPLTDAQDITMTVPATYQTEVECYMAAKPWVLKIEKQLALNPIGEVGVIRFYCKQKIYV